MFPPEPVTYCTGKTSSLGCVPFLVTTGLPSATTTTPFTIEGRDLVPGEATVLLYGLQKSNPTEPTGFGDTLTNAVRFVVGP